MTERLNWTERHFIFDIWLASSLWACFFHFPGFLSWYFLCCVGCNSNWNRTETYLEFAEFQAEVTEGWRGTAVHHRPGLLHLRRAGSVTHTPSPVNYPEFSLGSFWSVGPGNTCRLLQCRRYQVGLGRKFWKRLWTWFRTWASPGGEQAALRHGSTWSFSSRESSVCGMRY